MNGIYKVTCKTDLNLFGDSHLIKCKTLNDVPLWYSQCQQKRVSKGICLLLCNINGPMYELNTYTLYMLSLFF